MNFFRSAMTAAALTMASVLPASAAVLVADTALTNPTITDTAADAQFLFGDVIIEALSPVASADAGFTPTRMFLEGGTGFDPEFTLIIRDATRSVLRGESTERTAYVSAGMTVVEVLFRVVFDFTGAFGDKILATYTSTLADPLTATDPFSKGADEANTGTLVVQTVVPLPSSILLMGLGFGLAGAAVARRKSA